MRRAATSTTNDLTPATADTPAAFKDIFEANYAQINSYLRRRVSESDADDIASETFAIALKRSDHFDAARGEVRGWLFGIAANLLRSHWRTEKRQLRAYARSGIDPVRDEVADADERVDAARLGPVIAAALLDLPRVEREVLTLHAWAQLSHTEIASALDIPEGTVRSRLSKARARMRERL